MPNNCQHSTCTDEAVQLISSKLKSKRRKKAFQIFAHPLPPLPLRIPGHVTEYSATIKTSVKISMCYKEMQTTIYVLLIYLEN